MEELRRRPFFKGPRVTEKVRRRRKRESRDARERESKAIVRERERRCTRRGCRFPLCGCYRRPIGGVTWLLEVSHLKHKSMGGNPKEDRSVPELMIQVCGQRHKDGRIAIDKGTLECRPLTDAGTNGPVSWWVSLEDLTNPNVAIDWVSIADVMGAEFIVVDGWLELARETQPGTLQPLTALQQEALDFLAQMEF